MSNIALCPFSDNIRLCSNGNINLCPWIEGDCLAMSWKTDGSVVYITTRVSESGGRIYQGTVNTPWDISTLVLTSYIYSETAYPMGIAWKPDGTKMYEGGQSHSSIHQYSAESSWDLLSTTLEKSYIQYTHSTGGIAWGNSGYSFYEISDGKHDILQYDASTAYDIDTLTFIKEQDTYDNYPRDVAWKPDGLVFYEINEDYQSEIRQWYLDTAWDIKSSSSRKSIRAEGNDDSMGLTWKPDGTKMYQLSDDKTIYEFNVSTSWDIDTAVLNQTKTF